MFLHGKAVCDSPLAERWQTAAQAAHCTKKLSWSCHRLVFLSVSAKGNLWLKENWTWHRQIHDVEEVRRGRLSEEERALERDYDVDGTASADDREGDDRWLTQQSPSQDMQVLSPSPLEAVQICQRCRDRTDSSFWLNS